jgi:predicted small secreted protein
LLNNQLVYALLLLVSLLTACNGTTSGGSTEVGMQSNRPATNTTSVPTTEATFPPSAAGDAVRIGRWSRNPNWPSLAALGRGRLAIVNNCLVMQGDQDVPPTLLIFPYDKGVWDDAKRTFTFGGKVIGIGEPIEVTGGSIKNRDHLKVFGKYDVPDCGTNHLFQVFF